MLCVGQQIRLTRNEIARLTHLTDIEPEGIRCLGDLDAYVARCKAFYWGHSEETRFLHWLIDREIDLCRRAL